MAGLADLTRYQPAIITSFRDQAFVGTSWQWGPFINVEDDSGAAIDLTGITATCELYLPPDAEGDDGTVVATLDVTLGVGEFAVSKSADATANIAPGTYGWRCRFIQGPVVVQVWGGDYATLTVKEA